MYEYERFELRIEGDASGGYRVHAQGLKGRSARGRFESPVTDTDLELFALRIGRKARGARGWSSPQIVQARELGSALFQALFQEDVRQIYRESIAEAGESEKGLRITLHLTEVPELMHVPWEYLCDDRDFLGLSEQTPVVRYLDVSRPYKPLKVQPPLRLLGMVSHPSGVEELDVEREKKNLETALENLTSKGLMEISWLKNATFPALTRELAKDDFHIFHYIGHGGYDPGREDGLLVFEDRNGNPDEVMGSDLAVILGDEQPLRLAVLNACEGARSSKDDPFAGVAASLVRRDVPAVIAMQFEITDEAAIVFSEMLYTALVAGHSVDASVAHARRAIFAEKNYIEWGTPVLFMRVPDGCIFKIDQTMTEVAKLVEPEVKAVPKVEPVRKTKPIQKRPVQRRESAAGRKSPRPKKDTINSSKPVADKPRAPKEREGLMAAAHIEKIARTKLPGSWFWGGAPGEIAIFGKHLTTRETILDMATAKKGRMTPGCVAVTDRRVAFAWKGVLGGEDFLDVQLDKILAVEQKTSFWSSTAQLMISTADQILTFDEVPKNRAAEIVARLQSMSNSPE